MSDCWTVPMSGCGSGDRYVPIHCPRQLLASGTVPGLGWYLGVEVIGMYSVKQNAKPTPGSRRFRHLCTTLHTIVRLDRHVRFPPDCSSRRQSFPLSHLTEDLYKHLNKAAARLPGEYETCGKVGLEFLDNAVPAACSSFPLHIQLAREGAKV